MPASQIALLGAIAGFTIYLGLPIGRMRGAMPKTKAFLNATAIGILIFLLWDVLSHAWEPTDTALSDHHYATAVPYALSCSPAWGWVSSAWSTWTGRSRDGAPRSGARGLARPPPDRR